MKKELTTTKAELTEQAADLQAEIDEVAAEAKHNQTLISAGIKGLEEMILQARPRPISPHAPPLERILHAASATPFAARSASRRWRTRRSASRARKRRRKSGCALALAPETHGPPSTRMTRARALPLAGERAAASHVEPPPTAFLLAPRAWQHR